MALVAVIENGRGYNFEGEIKVNSLRFTGKEIAIYKMYVI
jgi:hypothetical protein